MVEKNGRDALQQKKSVHKDPMDKVWNKTKQNTEVLARYLQKCVFEKNFVSKVVLSEFLHYNKKIQIPITTSTLIKKNFKKSHGKMEIKWRGLEDQGQGGGRGAVWSFTFLGVHFDSQ